MSMSFLYAYVNVPLGSYHRKQNQTGIKCHAVFYCLCVCYVLILLIDNKNFNN